MQRMHSPLHPAGKRAIAELKGFSQFFFFYCRKKILAGSSRFEMGKNRLVKFFIMKRGRYNRPFLHLTTMGALGIGVLLTPLLADTYPIFSSSASTVLSAKTEPKQQSIEVGQNVFETNVSLKPRDKIITYTVQKGDTVESIARKFSLPNIPISPDTIKWENDLDSDNLTIGQELRILPVTGIAHKVAAGDTIYTIAKKYDTEAQKIADFPFNDFSNPDTFALVVGQIIIVPDGIKPTVSKQERQNIKEQSYKTYVATAPAPAQAAGGGYVFPLPANTGISQYPAWYHMALDITAPVGTTIVAAHAGTVVEVQVGGWNYGYGTNVYIDNGDGMKTHYAHMSGVNVSVGQTVSAGQTVGWVGLTGRTTGAHLHFEILQGGTLVNPVPYVL